MLGSGWKKEKRKEKREREKKSLNVWKQPEFINTLRAGWSPPNWCLVAEFQFPFLSLYTESYRFPTPFFSQPIVFCMNDLALSNHIGKWITVALKSGKTQQGYFYTMDPDTKSMILYNPPSAIVVLGHSIGHYQGKLSRKHV
jgi:hypothetical protein